MTHILPRCLPAAGQHNDARMNLAIALTAARYGAATANYTEVLRLLKRTEPGSGKQRVCGARCRDVLTGVCHGRELRWEVGVGAGSANGEYGWADKGATFPECSGTALVSVIFNSCRIFHSDPGVLAG